MSRSIWKGCGRKALLRLRPLLPALLLSAGTGCGDATRPEQGGSYVATVMSPAGQADGAVVIELAGRGVSAVAEAGGRLFVERLPGDLTRIVIVNDAPGPLRFLLEVAPGSDMPRATIIEVADTADQLRPSLAGYRVSMQR